MKPISKFLPSKKYWLLIPLTFLAFVIWQYGPLLLLAHHYPLHEPHKRVVLILALFLAWALKFLCLDYLHPLSPEDQNLAQMLHTLRGRFIGASKFLKKTIIDKHGYSTPLSQLPWYLLIGPPGSGKTSLLTHSNINFILSKQRKQEGQEKMVAASSTCDWWVTRDLVLIDVPGHYTFSPIKDPLSNSSLQQKEEEQIPTSKSPIQLSLWQSLLQLLIKYRQKNNIGALIVALPLPELMKQPRQQQAQWFQELKQRLSEYGSKFGKVPVYLFITKCDLLPGFSEFFNDIGSDELMQPWGIPLSGRKEHEKLLDMFTERFNALIKRLNKQLIWRLNQERIPQSRHLIKDFPLQLEFIRETLGQLIKSLNTANPNFDLEGTYLFSATQENPSANATLFHHDLPSALDILPSSPFVSRPYFIKHVISYLLPHTSQHLMQRFHQRKSWIPKLAYGLGFSFLFIFVLSLGRDFQRGLSQLSSVQHHIGEYQLYLQQSNSQESAVTAIANALPLLNTLQAAAQTSTPASRLKQIETPYSSRSQHTAVAVYRKALQNIILPQVRNEFEKFLEGTTNDKNPEQLYVALKAYLMLKQPEQGTDKLKTVDTQKLACNFIIHTLEQISPTFSRKSQNNILAQTNFAQHLQNALQYRQENTLNNNLIKETRKTLNHLSDTELAYILVKNTANNNQESDLNFGTNIGTPPALISKGTMTQIPFMFTAQAFSLIIKDQIPLAAKEVIMGNEVLGRKLIRPEALLTTTETIATLRAQLEKTYINNYIDVWESLVDNISLNSPKNLTETDAMIMNLISTHSPLLQLLQTIHNNTDLDPILSSSLKLQTLNTLFNQTQTQQKDSLFEIFTNLKGLHQFLQQNAGINPTHVAKLGALENSIQQATTEALLKEKLKAQQDAMSTIRTVAEKYPEPIRNWLQTLVSYTQNYLQTEDKPTIINPKPSQNEANNTPVEPQKPVIIPIIKEASLPEEPQINPPHYQDVEKQATNYTKKLGHYSKIRNLGLEKEAQSAFPENNKQRVLAKNKELSTSHRSNPGEFVKVIASNDHHPQIYVQKD